MATADGKVCRQISKQRSWFLGLRHCQSHVLVYMQGSLIDVNNELIVLDVFSIAMAPDLDSLVEVEAPRHLLIVFL